MAKSILDIVIRFAKEGDADKDSIKALQNVKTGVSNAMLAMGALAGVAATLSGIVVNLSNVFKDYTLQVADLSRLTGTSMEETSRMIQVADDLGISYEGLQKSLWFAAKQGIEVNLEALGRMSDEYNGFSSAAERATFLAKNFGRGGAEMGKLLQVGSEGQKQLTASVEAGLIVTEKSRQKALEYTFAVDQLSDAWYGLKVSIGQALVPLLTGVLTDIPDALNDQAVAMQLAKSAGEEWASISPALRAGYLDQAAAQREAFTALKMHQSALDGDTEATDAATAATQAYKNAMSDLTTLISGDLGKAEDDHLQKIADLNAEMEKARSPKEKEGIQAQIDAETAAYERQTNAILYNIQSQIIMRTTSVTDEEKLAALTQLAEGYGLLDAKTRSAVDATNTLVGAWLSGAITTDDFIDRLGEVGSETGATASQIHLAAEYSDDQTAATKNVGDASKDAIEPVDGFAGSMNQVGKAADYAAGEINQVISQAKALDGMVSVVTIVINTIGEMPSFGNNKGKGGLAVATGGAFGGGFYSAGGQWTPGTWAVVGDAPGGGLGPYTEAIDPWGYIHNARETRMLAAMGVLKGAQSLYAAEGSGSRLDNRLFFPGRNQPGRQLDDLVRNVRSSTGSAGLGSLGGGETASLADVVGTLEQSAASTSQAAFAASRSADMQAQQSVRQTDVLQSGNEAIVSELQELRRDLPAALQDAVKLVV